MSGNTADRALTPQAHALGVGLRAAREKAGYGLRELARKLNMQQPSTLSRWEHGTRHPRVEDVGILLGVLNVDTDERERLLALARDSTEPQWLSIGMSEQHQLATLLHYEQDADQITDVSQFIPGLLQTEDYARAVIQASQVPPDEISMRVAIRLGRRDMLRTRSTKLLALIGEAALHYQVGGPEVLLDQLCYLLEVSAWDTVELQIVPFSAGWHEGLLSAFILVDRTGDDPVVHLETAGSSLFLHGHNDTAMFRVAAEKVRALAMSPNDSAELIASTVQAHQERNQ
jgi:transcriptional regulator with XRE-family HTH domain